MGVNVREKVKGSGVFWIFINHNGKRTSRKVGDEDTANEVAEKIRAKITLGGLNIEEQQKSSPTFKEYAKKWLAFIAVMRQGTTHERRGHAGVPPSATLLLPFQRSERQGS